MEKDAFYFPHFCNARNDRKVKRLRKELGIEGYGIFFMILEILREQTDYRYPIDDLDLLADEFNTSEQKVRAVVSNYDLFKVDTKNKLFSAKLIIFLQPMLKMREKAKVAATIRWDKYKSQLIQDGMSNAQALLKHCSSNAQAMPKLCKEGKEKKGKESIIRPDFFSEKSWSDLLSYRREKKASKSDMAMQPLVEEFRKSIESGFTVEQCLGEMASRNWTGFKLAWLENANVKPSGRSNGAHNCALCDYKLNHETTCWKEGREKCSAFRKAAL